MASTSATNGLTIWKYMKMNPLLSGILVLILVGIIYFAFNTLYAGAQIALLEHANNKLAERNTELLDHANQLENTVTQRDGVIEQQTKELTEKDALLQATAKQTTKSKANLDDATATAARIMGDDSVLSREQLKQKLCELYNIKPESCL